MHLPHWITFFRIFISPIFLLLYIEYQSLGISLQALPYLLMILLAVSEISDAFDGFVARRWKMVTDLGKILDPMADSIYRISVFLTFTQGVIQLPLLLIFIFIYRDAVISTLRTVCALRGFALAARKSGKIKAIVQGVVAFFILILFACYTGGEISLEQLQRWSFWSTAAACLYALFSGIDYIIANREYVKRLLLK